MRKFLSGLINLGSIGTCCLFFYAGFATTEFNLVCANETSQPSNKTESIQIAEATQEFKKLTLKELMDLEVTSVSRRPQKLSESAASIQAITQEDIRRSGASRLPEALRLASNLEVYQIDTSNWAITARGFNNTLANKLLVMLDGRTIYTPLFAGVFWDVQDTLLEDIDQIEVISGPGATSWGANAVNGVINIKTKNAKDTQGLLLLGGGGTELRDFAGIRYGGLMNSNTYYRVYGKYFDRDGSVNPAGEDIRNDWRMAQGGFRVDWEQSQSDSLKFQGDIYDGGQSHENDLSTSGGNLIGRWLHTISELSNYRLQFYFDRTHRHSPESFEDALHTYDLDFQHRFSFLTRHDVVWGVGYRMIRDNFESTPSIALLPRELNQQTFSTFLQDEIALLQDRLSVTLGTKIEHNDYTGFEIQPSGRIAWKFSDAQMLWGAISRAVRTPSRIDRDLFIPDAPPFVIAGGPNFVSEELLAYELGYRIHPNQQLFVSLATFYNDYDKIRTFERLNPAFPIPIVAENKQEGESYGAEFTADYRLSDSLRIWAGYNELRVDIRPKPGSTDRTFGATESHDPERQFFLRASVDLPSNLEFDPMFRYVSEIENVNLPSYGQLDLRLAWMPVPGLELSIVGQNLLHDHRIEFGLPNAGQAIERSVYGKVLWQF